MSKTNTVAARARLADRAEPYWTRVIVGVYLGFRKTATASTWSIRYRDPATLKQKYKALGDYGTIPDAQRFDAAFRAAQAFAQHVATGGITEPKTVADSCHAFVAQLNTESGKADTLKRFERHVFDDPSFANLKLEQLKKQHVTAWLNRLKAKPVMRGSGRGSNPSLPTDKARSDATINRDVAVLRAALNFALDADWTTTDNAWRVPLAPIKSAGNRRDLYLDRAQRQRLIEAAGGGAIANFLRALSMLPVRPGALAALTVGNYDPRRKLLNIRIDKTKVREIVLPDGAAAFFAEQCRGKLPGAYIFPRDDGRPMNKDFWKNPVKASVRAAGLPDDVIAYSLRHSTITDLIATGIPSLTVAQLSGTSVAMIEKHYGHLTATAATAALASLAL